MRLGLRWTVGVVLLCMPMAAAAKAVPTMRGLSPFDAQEWAKQALQPTTATPMRMTPLTDSKTPLPSFVHIAYASARPLPLLIGPHGALPQDMLFAMLPAGDAQQATIDMRRSPAWRPGKRGVMLTLYWLEGSEPVILDVGPQSGSNPFATSLIALGHVLRNEGFGSFSINFLLGYRVLSIPLTVLLGAAGVVVVVCMRRRHSAPVAIGICALLLIAAWQVRFLPDVLAMEWQEQADWWSDSRAGELGHTAAIAAEIRNRQQDDAAVTVCTQQATPLKYFLYPVPVRDASAVASGGMAVVDQVWNDRQQIGCGAWTGSGEVLWRFANSDALVRIPPVLP